MRKTLLLVFTLVAGATVGVLGNEVLHAQQPTVKRTVLLTHDLAGLEGKEGVLVEAVIPPGGQSGWHHHSGQELFYVAEGSGVYEIKEKPSGVLKAGAGYYNSEVHNIRNTGAEPLRLIGFFLAEKGKPLTTPDNPPQ